MICPWRCRSAPLQPYPCPRSRRADLDWRFTILIRRDDMEINGVEIEDTFAEGFPIKVARVLITAVTKHWALVAAREATGFGTSVIGCSAEAGIESIVSGDETPDGRPGVNILICNMGYKNLENSLLFRLGQCVLTAPTTAAFSGMSG